MVSCRFKRTRATDVQAASSAGSMSAGAGRVPVESKARAAAGWAAVLVVMPGKNVQEDRGLLGIVRVATGPVETPDPAEPAGPRPPRASPASPGRGRPRRRSGRSRGRAPGAACSTAVAGPRIPRGSRRRRRAGWGAETCAASRCRGRGDTGSRPDRPRSRASGN